MGFGAIVGSLLKTAAKSGKSGKKAEDSKRSKTGGTPKFLEPIKTNQSLDPSSRVTKRDTGFYGHSQVPGRGKSDSFYKNIKNNIK